MLPAHRPCKHGSDPDKVWPVIEIEGANHMTCILKPQFRDELAAWLKKHAH
jgi:hypothetical protein